MTTTTADALALLDPATPDTWPQGILAAADLREQRAKRMGSRRWTAFRFVVTEDGAGDVASTWPDTSGETAEHIAAEANPAHALTAVHHWRGVVDRHGDGLHSCVGGSHGGRWESVDEGQGGARFIAEPCPDLTETADDARAYLGGAA